MDEEVLFHKEGFQFVKIQENQYKLDFSIENQNIILSKIIDFNLIKLIYDLNTDIYEKVYMDKLNDNQVICTLLMKNLFEDLGLPQRFSYLHIDKVIEEGIILFSSKSIKSHRPADVPPESELMSIENMTILCDVINPHKMNCSIRIILDNEQNIPNVIEKIVGIILNKIFKRVKQFIENVRL